MARATTCLATVLLVLVPGGAGGAAEGGGGRPDRVGIGASLDVLGFGELLAYKFPTPVSVLVPINVGSVRLEPSFGAATSGTDHHAVATGLGALYVHRPAPGYSFYAGPRLAVTFRRHHFNGPGTNASTADFHVAAAVGGEWWVHPRVALGVEARLLYAFYGAMRSEGRVVESSMTSIQTRSALVLRTYAF